MSEPTNLNFHRADKLNNNGILTTSEFLDKAKAELQGDESIAILITVHTGADGEGYDTRVRYSNTKMSEALGVLNLAEQVTRHAMGYKG